MCGSQRMPENQQLRYAIKSREVLFRGTEVPHPAASDIECKSHGRGRVHQPGLADCPRSVFVPVMARPRPVVFRKAMQSPTVILFVCTHSYAVLEFRCPIANSVWTPKDAPPRCEELLRMYGKQSPVDALIAPYRALPSRPLDRTPVVARNGSMGHGSGAEISL